MLKRCEPSASNSESAEKETDSGEKQDEKPKKRPATKSKKEKKKREVEEDDTTSPFLDKHPKDDDDDLDDPQADGDDGSLDVHGRPSKRPATKQTKTKKGSTEKKKKHKKFRKHRADQSSSNTDSDSEMKDLHASVRLSLERAQNVEEMAHNMFNVEARFCHKCSRLRFARRNL